MTVNRTFVAAATAIALLPLVAGCTGEDDAGAQPSVGSIVSAGSSGFTAEARANSVEIGTADRLEFIVRQVVPQGFTPAPLEIETLVGEFEVIEERALEPVAEADGSTRFETIYLLEPFLPGAYTIGPTPLIAKEIDGGRTLELTLEPSTINVTSEFDPDSALQLGAMKETLSIPPSRTPIVIGVVGGGLLLGGAIALGIWRLSRPTVIPPPPADETALSRLRHLLDRQLVESGEFDLFYTELSSILRHYIEDQFDARAPEQTTEEFLAEIHGSTLFTGDDQTLLRQFLLHCDLVKFARLEPSVAQAEDSMVSARSFIERTAMPFRIAAVEGGAS